MTRETPIVPADGAPAELASLLAAVQASVPQAMRERPHWLLWRFEQYAGDVKPRKVPYYVSGRKRRGVQGSDEDRAELAAFDLAVTHLARGQYTGLGFAFLPGDALVGIDIDNAIDDDGVVSERCQAIVKACDSYAEYSPSGRGVHIIGSAGFEVRSFRANAIGLEVYSGRQFFTVTGRRWPDAPVEVHPLSEKLVARLQATREAARGAAKATAPARPAPEADDLHTRLEGALQVLSPEAYDEWVQAGMALKHGLGDAGFRLWDYWSSKSAKYPGTADLERKWASFAADGGVTEATIFKLAMAAGWKPPRTRKAAGRGAAPAGGISTPSSGSAAVGGDGPPGDEPPPDAAEGESRKKKPARAAWAEALKNDRNGPADCRENVFLLLTQHPELTALVGWDEFAHRVVKLRQPPWDSPTGEWLPQDDYSLGLWLMQTLGMTIKSEGTLVAGVGMAAWAARYHPVLQYLHALPAWDGTERLPFWLSDCLGAEDTTYTRLIGTWFVMGMVQRVTNPGCQMDYMLVLEGLQGRRKSTALATLMPSREWFADTPMRLGDKDSMLSLAGKWLVEMGELASLSRAETEEIKQYVTSRVDRVREPFARRFVDRPRSCVFGGTTNQGEYFKDPTGARRFWPVHCNGVPQCDGGVDLAKLAEWRDQLFAEAVARLADPDPEVARHYPTREESELYLQPEQEQREISDPWFERLAVWLESRTKFGDSVFEVREVESFTSQELLTSCIGVPMDRIDGARQMSTRIGIAMHKLGWAKRRDASPPRLWRYWRPTPAKSDTPAQAGASTDGTSAGVPAEGAGT